MIEKLTFRIASCLVLVIGIHSCSGLKSVSSHSDVILADNPTNSSYLFENEWIQLAKGCAERKAAPGSSSMISIAVLGQPIYGDLTNDIIEDAVLFFTYEGGGSGTFYYIGAALAENGLYRGLNTILLGDRISRPVAKLTNGLITVTYLDRKHDEPMVAAPSQEQKRYFSVTDTTLREIKPAVGEALYQGWLTIGHEVRSFLPCDEKEDLRLHGSSPALDQIIAAYRKTLAGFPPYTPVFAVISGRRIPASRLGYGADYQETFWASDLIHIWQRGNCRSDLIIADFPLPGVYISSPLLIKGKARGPWFFEGDFPVLLFDGQGNKIAESYATAQAEWMTQGFVNFEGTLRFDNSFAGTRGMLILRRDNPTDMPQFDDALEIPVNFE